MDIEKANTKETLAIAQMWTVLNHANANQITPNQREELRNNRERAVRLWQSCIRLAWIQIELGGLVYIEDQQTCMTWRLQDGVTRQLLYHLSTCCIRDQCVDNLQHPTSGQPMQKAPGVNRMAPRLFFKYGQ